MIRIRSKSRISKRGKSIKRWFYSSICISLLIIGSFVYYILSPDYVISKVNVEGQSLSKKEEVVSVVEKYLNDKLMIGTPVHNWLLFPKSKLQKELSNNPAYKDVEVQIDRNDINIIINERIPSYVWCGNNPEIIESCMFVDDEAIIFANAPVFQGGTYTKLFMNIPQEVLGKSVQSKDILDRMKKNIELWKDVGIEINSVVWNDGTTAIYHAVSGLEIMVDKQMEPAVIINNIHAFLISGEKPISLDDIKYIDLRSPHKIFFKRK